MEKKVTSNWIIKCPHCGAEYYVSEIFYPEDLLGNPKTIIKDPLGKILYVEHKLGEEPNLIEHFICDSCEKPFVVEASFSFKATPEPEETDFSTDTVSLL